MPTVALFGRPNVGKSALFNALLNKDLSLVFDRPGTTRDQVVGEVSWEDRKITLIDTGGLGYDAADTLDQAVFREAEMAASTADLVLWVLDGREGLVPLDHQLADWLRRHAKNVLHVVNKLDTPAADILTADFAALGADTIIPVSAEHRRGLDTLKKIILSQLPPPSPGENNLNAQERCPPPVRITLVGRPNVGKSSLTNKLLGSQRTIVNPTAGTTRDAVEIPLAASLIPGREVILVDTAGMRARSALRDPLEQRMTSRTAHAINCSNIILHLIEVADGFTTQDKKIAGLIQKAGRACIIVVNKWDTASSGTEAKKIRQLRKDYANALRNSAFFQNHAPIVFLSALTGEGIEELRQAISRVADNLSTDIPTGPLNRIIQQYSRSHPPPLRGNTRFKILYASAQRQNTTETTANTSTVQQAATQKILEKNSPNAKNTTSFPALLPPRIIGFCNNRRLLDTNWLAALEKKIRAAFPLEGIPLLWHWRDRTEKQPDISSPKKIPAKRSKNLPGPPQPHMADNAATQRVRV